MWDGAFEPVLVRERQRRLDGIDNLVLSLTARGLTTCQISAQFSEVHRANISKDTISKITDKGVEEMRDILGLWVGDGGDPGVSSARPTASRASTPATVGPYEPAATSAPSRPH